MEFTKEFSSQKFKSKVLEPGIISFKWPLCFRCGSGRSSFSLNVVPLLRSKLRIITVTTKPSVANKISIFSSSHVFLLIGVIRFYQFSSVTVFQWKILNSELNFYSVVITFISNWFRFQMDGFKHFLLNRVFKLPGDPSVSKPDLILRRIFFSVAI